MEMGLVGEYIAGLGVDAAKHHMDAKIDEHKLKSVLKEYVESQRKYQDICALAEECDFQGIIEYVTEELLDDLEQRFFSLKKDARRKAHEEIISRAVVFSKAATEEVKKHVSRLISVSLELVRQFFKKKVSVSDYLLAAEIVDAVEENTAESIKSAVLDIKDNASELKDEILEKMESIKGSIVGGSLYSVENISQMAAMSQFPQIEKNIKKLFAGMSLEHPLYPDYGFTFDGNSLKSTPLSADAQQKYPARLHFKGTVRVGNHYFNDASVDPVDYAYRHQLKLVMSVSEALKLLGNRPDPIQTEAERLVGKDIIATPPKFPEAFPCSIKVGDKTHLDYILLRTEEILDDGTYIIGNKEQTDSKIYFEVRINPEKPGKEDFRINIIDADNHELLKFVMFMDELAKNKELHIYALDKQEDFIAGTINDVNYKTGFYSVSEEIEFLKRVCAIEDYFHVKMNISGDISEEEYGCVFRVSELIFNDKVEGTWKEASFTGVLQKEFRQAIENLDSSAETLSYVGTCDVNLFGAEFSFEYMRTFKCAVIQEIDRIRSLVSCLEDGDPIKIKLAPGDDRSAFDTLHIPEKIKEDFK